jgi:hypothetical protein
VGFDWFADVHLDPSNVTTIVTEDRASAAVGTNLILWSALNLFDPACSNGLAIRRGSSLQFTAACSNAAGAQVTFTILDAATNAVTNLVAALGAPVRYCFEQPGAFFVQGVVSNATVCTNATLAVQVVAASFPEPEAVCVTGQERTWDCPALTTAAVLVADSRLSVTATNRPHGGLQLGLLNPTDGPLYLVARLGTDGPILDSAKISSVYGDHGTYFRVVEAFGDGSRMVEVRLQLGYVSPDLEVKLRVIVGGVTFLDGALDKTLTAADFDEMGVCSYRLLQAAWASSSTCHTTMLYQDGIYIGGN